MTTIRNFRCNDFLEITAMVFHQIAVLDKTGIASLPLSDYMHLMARLPNYFLVAVTPGNRIRAYGTAEIQRNNNTQKYCEITETSGPTTDFIGMFIKIIEERADKIDEVYYLEIWMPPTATQQSVDLLEQMGFTSTGEQFDDERGNTESFTVFKKDLSQNRAAAAQN